MAMIAAARQPQRQPWLRGGGGGRGPGMVASVKVPSRQHRRVRANHSPALGAKPAPNLVWRLDIARERRRRRATEDAMPIDYEQMMQSKSQGLEASYGDREVMLYALGIGFQRDPMNEAELPFTYENDLQVIPTFATVIPRGV